MCTSSAVVPPPGVSSDTVVPPATVANEGIDVGTNVLVVAAPAPVVEQPSPEGRPRLPHQRYREEQRMTRRRPFRLTVFRRDTLRMFRTRAVCLMCHRFRQDSSFGHREGVSPLRLRGYYCRRRWTTSMIRFWEIRSHMRGVNSFSGVRVPIVFACVCVAVWFCLPAGSYSTSDCVGFRDLLSAGGGDLGRCSAYRFGGGPVIRDRTAGLSIPILGVRRPAVFGCESSVWPAASSSSVSGVRRSTGVGPAPRLFADVLGGSAGQGTSDGSGHQPTAGCGHHVVKSSDTVPVRNSVTQNVVPDDGLGHRTVVVSESRGRRLVTGAASSSGGIVYVGHGPVAPSDGSG